LARLSDGYLDGFLIECLLHQGLFDIRSGKCAGDPVDVDLASYDVRIVDEPSKFASAPSVRSIAAISPRLFQLNRF
jgi:nitrite reductase/ring-hydroxylating ferredoxin subunit